MKENEENFFNRPEIDWAESNTFIGVDDYLNHPTKEKIKLVIDSLSEKQKNKNEN